MRGRGVRGCVVVLATMLSCFAGDATAGGYLCKDEPELGAWKAGLRTLTLRSVCAGALEEQSRLEGEIGGSGEIRTHERVAPLPVFKTGPFNRSGTLPRKPLSGGRRLYPPLSDSQDVSRNSWGF